MNEHADLREINVIKYGRNEINERTERRSTDTVH